MSNKIVMNSLAMYARLAISVPLAILTSRYLINTLGAGDFGVYAVLAGFVSMMTFFESAIVNTTQTYLTIEGLSKSVFSSALWLAIMVIGVYLVIAESIGLWYVGHFIKSTSSSRESLGIIYQSLVLLFTLSILSSVFSALLMVKEKFALYAWFQLSETVIRFIVAIGICFIQKERLVIYSLVTLGSVGLLKIASMAYCFITIPEATFEPRLRVLQIKRMIRLVGWNSVDCLFGTINLQGLNLLLNFFFGPVVNAARGISLQVQSVCINFGGSYFSVARQQLLVRFTQGDVDELWSVFSRISRINIIVFSIFIFPIILNSELLLHIWLKSIPAFSWEMVSITCFAVLAEALFFPINALIYASGKKLRTMQMVNAFTSLASIALIITLFRIGFSPLSGLVVFSVFRFLQLLVVYSLADLFIDRKVGYYLKNIVLCPFLIICGTLLLGYLFKHLNFLDVLSNAVFSTIIAVTAFLCASWIFVIESTDRDWVKNGVHKLRLRWGFT